MAGVAITRMDMSAADLRAAAKRSANAKQGSRILAIAMVLDGFSREEAARLCGMDRQTLRDWVHRYNKEGLEGLADRARSGRPASLSWVEQGKFASWVKRPSISPGTASCGSGAPICVTASSPSLASPCTNAAWVSCSGGSTSAVFPFARNTAIRCRGPGDFQKTSQPSLRKRSASALLASQSRSGSRCYEAG